MAGPQQAFGRHLRQLREDRGYSQEAFALKVGMDRTYVGGIERGERNVSLVNICKLAEALDITPPEMMDFSQK